MAEVDAGAVAPAVNTPVAAEQATSLPGSTADQETGSTTPTQAQPEPTEPEKLLPQSEVNKLLAREKAQAEKRAERRAMDRFRAEHAERELERLRAERNPAPTAAPSNTGEPQPGDFATPAEYVKALVRYEREQVTASSEREMRVRSQRQQAAEEAVQMREALMDGAHEFEDFEDVVFAPNVPITPPMAHAIVEVEGIKPAKVAHYLATHVEEAQAIAGMKPTRQVAAIDALAKRLAAPPRPTQTPAPIVPSTGSASVQKGYEGMNTAEHVNAYLRRKRR
jgi:hypothetical protein